MKITELIRRLEKIREEHGDDVLVVMENAESPKLAQMSTDNPERVDAVVIATAGVMGRFKVSQFLAAAFVAVMLAGCGGASPINHEATSYRLENGKTVHCAKRYWTECGFTLRKCTNGRTYLCAQNVEQLN